MKKTLKIITVFLTLAAMLAFTACGKSGTNSGQNGQHGENTVSAAQNNTASDTGISPPNETSAQKGELFMLHETGCWNCQSSVCYTENGYYRFGAYRENEYDHLLYLDYATGQEVVVCSDSSCKHDTPNCASVFSDRYAFQNHLFVFEDYLYCLATDLDEDGSTQAGGGFMTDEVRQINEELEANRHAVLYRMNLDGTERQKLWQSDAGYIAETEVFCDGTGFWFVTKQPTFETHEETGAGYHHSKNRAFIRYDLGERKITDKIPLEDYNNIALRVDNCTGDKFFLFGKAYPNGTSVMDNFDILAPGEAVGSINPDYWDFNDKCECVYFTLDVKTKELKEITRYKIADMNFGADFRDGMLYFERPDDTCFTYDIETGETAEVNIPDGYRLDGFFADKMILSHYPGDHSDHATYYADLDCSNMTRSELLGNDGVGIELVTIVGDDALVIVGFDGIPSKTHPDAYECTTPLYALISLDDLYNGRANYRKFDMINAP